MLAIDIPAIDEWRTPVITGRVAGSRDTTLCTAERSSGVGLLGSGATVCVAGCGAGTGCDAGADCGAGDETALPPAGVIVDGRSGSE